MLFLSLERSFVGNISLQIIYMILLFYFKSGDTNHETLHSQLDGESNPA